jgi:hypothetical protein
MSYVDLEMKMDAPLARVWAAMVDVSSFPKFMNAVQDTQVIEESGDGRRITSWSVMRSRDAC